MSENVHQDNKGIKKEIVIIFLVYHVHSTLEKYLKKVLYILQVVNKETQSLLLTYSRFHALF